MPKGILIDYGRKSITEILDMLEDCGCIEIERILPNWNAKCTVIEYAVN